MMPVLRCLTRVAGSGVVLCLCGVPTMTLDATPAAGRQEAQAPLLRVRPVRDGPHEAASLFDEAVRRSPTIRTLVTAIEQTDIIVYIERVQLHHRAGQLTLMGASHGFRWLRISLDVRSEGDGRIEWLGHELAHALEVAQARRVQSQASLKMLYMSIGRKSFDGHAFETDGAEATGRLVALELSGR